MRARTNAVGPLTHGLGGAESIVRHGQALSVTCESYAGMMNFGFTGWHSSLPGLQRLALHAVTALEDLEASSRPRLQRPSRWPRPWQRGRLPLRASVPRPRPRLYPSRAHGPSVHQPEPDQYEFLRLPARLWTGNLDAGSEAHAGTLEAAAGRAEQVDQCEASDHRERSCQVEFGTSASCRCPDWLGLFATLCLECREALRFSENTGWFAPAQTKDTSTGTNPAEITP